MQVHPTAIPGEDKCRLMSESARGEGGRVWVPKKKGDPRHPNDIPEGERDYFLERIYPKYGNIVTRDIATREIYYICEQGFGIGGGQMVYLDLTERATGIPYATLKRKLGGILEIYEKFVGVDPLLEPMKIYPAIHYSMGGLWVDFVKDEKTGGLVAKHPRNQATNIPGLYAAGEADYQYHGANRLGANSLLSCITTGLVLGPCVKTYLGEAAGISEEASPKMFDTATKAQEAWERKLLGAQGTDNPYVLHRLLGKSMSDNVTIIRVNKKLRQTLETIQELKTRYEKNLGMPDTGTWTNNTLTFAKAVRDMLALSEAITTAAIARDESRGAHFKVPDDLAERHDVPLDDRCYPRDDEKWLKTTIVTCDGVGPDEFPKPKLSYAEVDTSLFAPKARTYGKTATGGGGAGAKAAEAVAAR